MDYVFRPNLPPLTMAEHIGTKSHFITCNPSILREKYERLFSRRKPFINHIKDYGSAMIVLPAFSYVSNTDVSFRVFYSVEEFKLKNKVVFYHPDYLSNISRYWRAMGIKARRLSSGVMLVTAAIELCDKVTLSMDFGPFLETQKGMLSFITIMITESPNPAFTPCQMSSISTQRCIQWEHSFCKLGSVEFMYSYRYLITL
ncbi:unnamed protein product [Staurois parvus]|uniref:Uncharacterized protein n=1 Tax=Staurois parvus TaxID=386267 RepID=A0ABN9ED04_9NEOB|nr:unnamed protein product [Staurois parvus]